MSHDPKCYELAKAFLSDTPPINNEGHADQLAQIIQDQIEQFIEDALEMEQARLAEDGPQNDDWLSDYYGGSGPQTERERYVKAWEEKRGLR